MPRLRTVPLIGALLLASSTVQASQTFEEITQPCKASEETKNACDSMALHFSVIAIKSYLCWEEQETKVTPELLTEEPKLPARIERKREIAKIAYNTAIEKVKIDYPKCSVKPIP